MVSVGVTKDSDFGGVVLHPCNIAEIRSLCSAEPIEALRSLSRWSAPRSYTVRDGDRILCFCGLDSKHEMWLFFTDIDSLPVSFFRVMRDLCKEHQRSSPIIYGMIYEKNVFALRFAKFMRAKIYDPKPFGFKGDLYYKFEIGG